MEAAQRQAAAGDLAPGAGFAAAGAIGRSGGEFVTVLLLGLSFGFAFYDRQLMTFVAPYVIPELRLTNLQVGALGSGLSLTWALGAFLIGRWSDRVGVRKPFLLAALVIFSVCSLLSGLASGFWPLFASRMLMGAVEGPFLPICLAIISAASPVQRRGLNNGIVQNAFGSILGNAVAPLVAVAIAAAYGWRVSFATAAVPGLLLALLVWRFIAEPPRPAGNVSAGGRTLGIGAMLAHRNVALCSAIACMLVGAGVLVAIFMPLYLTQVRHLSPGAMSVVMALLGLCPPVGGVLMPWLSDRIGRRRPLIAGAAMMVVTPLAALLVPGPLPFLVAVLLAGWIGMGSYPLFMGIVPAETLAFRSAAAAMGLVVGIGELTGGVGAPLLAGWAGDHFGLEAPLLFAAGASAIGALLAIGIVETNPRVRPAAAVPA